MKSKKFYITIIIPIIFSVFIESILLLNFDKGEDYKLQNNLVELYPSNSYTVNYTGYDIQENQFIPQNSDPQMLWNDIHKNIESILISFSDEIAKGTLIQVYYNTPINNFNEENSIQHIVKEDSDKVLIDVSIVDCISIRIDINAPFSLDNIIISDKDAVVITYFKESFHIFRTILICIVSFLLLKTYLLWYTKPKTEFSLSKLEIVYCLFCFIFYCLWAVSKRFDYAPDEAMRYSVSLFLYENNRLPINEETISNIWGFSYSHIPTMLCNILSYIPMKITGLFTKNSFALVIAARMVSVFSGTFIVYFVIKSTKLLFSTPIKWIMVVFISMIPQFLFLTSYVNNDILALLGSSIIFYSWILGMKLNWNYKNGLLLALGISICALSYYNSYGWILCSIIFFISSYLMKNKKDYKGLLKLGGFISVIVLLSISYMFIRHLILYDDLLGLQITKIYAEKYAQINMKPSNKLSIQQQGITLKDMLFGNLNWIEITYKSFIGYFGYMSVIISAYVYDIYTTLFTIGLLGLLYRLKEKIKVKKKDRNKEIYIFWLCIVICMIIPTVLSIHKSYNSDFQPQGRYCYPGILSLALILTKGIEIVIKRIKRIEYQYAVVGMGVSAIIMITISEFFTTYLPS